MKVTVRLDSTRPLEDRVMFEHEPYYITSNPNAKLLFSLGADRVVIPDGYPAFHQRHAYLKIGDIALTIMGSGDPIRQLHYKFEGVSDKY